MWNEAFSGCYNLKNIDTKVMMFMIGIKTFSNCKSLENITISDDCWHIQGDMFSECESLKKVNLPDSLTRCTPNAFHYCKSLELISYKGIDYNILMEGNIYPYFYDNIVNLSDEIDLYYGAREFVEIKNGEISTVDRGVVAKHKPRNITNQGKTSDICNSWIVLKSLVVNIVKT